MLCFRKSTMISAMVSVKIPCCGMAEGESSIPLAWFPQDQTEGTFDANEKWLGENKCPLGRLLQTVADTP